jgi:hypothetical protein
MYLTHFTTTNIIINYNSFLASRPPIPQGNEQFVNRRVLEIAEKVLNNLQKGIVDNTISTAAGLEKRKFIPGNQVLPYPNHQALPSYYANLHHLCRYILAKILVTLRNSQTITEHHREGR